MNIFFRADANKLIGMGHIMRCLSIADVFRSLQHTVLFIIADEDISDYIHERGYDTYVLNTDYQRSDEELPHWPSIGAGLIIVDSYYVTGNYLNHLKTGINATGGKLVFIDDLCAFPYPADILVNYNAYATPQVYHDLYRTTRVVSLPHLILGPKYVPLRTMFKNTEKKVQKSQIQNILISTGGADTLHVSLSLLKYLVGGQTVFKNTDIRYHFLLGAMNTDKESIRKLTTGSDRFVLHENVTDMKALISSCDLAISAAGSTLYEICACGVPLITYAISDNQLPGTEAFSNLGLGVSIGDLRDPNTINSSSDTCGQLKKNAINLIIESTTKLADDYEQRTQMANRMQNYVDGFGAERMVQIILDLSV